MVIEDETPMFSKQKVNFAPPERITHMSVSSDLIVLAMTNGIFFRIDLKQPDKPEGDFHELYHIVHYIDRGLHYYIQCVCNKYVQNVLYYRTT